VQGNLDTSESLYKKLLTIDPDNAQARQGLMNVARKHNHFELLGVAREALDRNQFDKAREALKTIYWKILKMQMQII
jgi:tetratricopeptide (TPR) repeat protein